MRGLGAFEISIAFVVLCVLQTVWIEDGQSIIRFIRVDGVLCQFEENIYHLFSMYISLSIDKFYKIKAELTLLNTDQTALPDTLY